MPRVRPRLRRYRWRSGIFAGVMLMSGCASPSNRIFDYADQHGFDREVVVGAPFRHVVFRNSRPLRAATLRIYLEGDGSPYVKERIAVADPTPRQPLMLHLLAKDPTRAVYVGRPCYLGLARDVHCSEDYWTFRRYSPEVLDSLEFVIREEMGRSGASSVELIGHSGGGALAVLLTQKLPVQALVTIAANLDITAWTRWHGYLPLSGSLNPVDVVLPTELALHTDHYAGAEDQNVPLAMLNAAAARIGGRVHVIQGYSHQCCWEEPSLIYWR